MRVALLSALLLCACRISLDDAEEPMDASTGRSCKVGTSSTCMQAETHADFTFIKTSIFPISCSASSSCHMSATASGKLDLSSANAYTSLMGAGGTGVMSNVDKTRMLIVPGQPKASYFFFLVHGVKADEGEPPFTPPPSMVGFMPQRNSPICCQKIDAIERWITAGALND
jgi:hypothetical protein